MRRENARKSGVCLEKRIVFVFIVVLKCVRVNAICVVSIVFCNCVYNYFFTHNVMCSANGCGCNMFNGLCPRERRNCCWRRESLHHSCRFSTSSF